MFVFHYLSVLKSITVVGGLKSFDYRHFIVTYFEVLLLFL